MKELVSLDLEQFKAMGYYAVSEYDLPIELMMENAGYHLAKLIGKQFDSSTAIKTGVGNGNNGGGGLVAARRLAAWGYPVYLDLATEIDKELPQKQLRRALKFGARIDAEFIAPVWVDAYLSFSQRLPLNYDFNKRMLKSYHSFTYNISLDLPAGFLGDPNSIYFNANQVLTLAAPKTILNHLPSQIEIYVADIGIPKAVYERFNIAQSNRTNPANRTKFLERGFFKTSTVVMNQNTKK